MNQPVLLLRTTKLDQAIVDRFRRLATGSDFHLGVVLDGRPPDEWTADFTFVPAGKAEFERRGLLCPDDVMWRCGDYGLISALDIFPHAPFFWLLEHDVELQTNAPEKFFSQFAKIDVDFIAPRVGIAPPHWFWHRMMVRYNPVVHKCLFPFLRISRRAVEHLRAERIRCSDLHKEWMRSGVVGSLDWPNDESFTATALVKSEFSVKDFNDIVSDSYSDDTFTVHKPISSKKLQEKPSDGKIYHPVLSGSAFLAKYLHSVYKAQEDGLSCRALTEMFNRDVMQSIQDESSDKEYEHFTEILAGALAVSESFLNGPYKPTNQKGVIVESYFMEKPIKFFVTNTSDFIQSFHARGKFYEDVELLLMLKAKYRRGLFVDVGAHTGNHLIFMAKFSRWRDFVCFEPQPALASSLVVNIALNGLDCQVDLTLVRFALGHQSGEGFISVHPENSGRGCLRWSRRPGEVGDAIPVRQFDALMPDRDIAFVKIDTSGNELDVLTGMRETLERCRPGLFVRMEAGYEPKILALLTPLGYKEGGSYSRHPGARSALYEAEG